MKEYLSNANDVTKVCNKDDGCHNVVVTFEGEIARFPNVGTSLEIEEQNYFAP